jgi:hypothetical protein
MRHIFRITFVAAGTRFRQWIQWQENNCNERVKFFEGAAFDRVDDADRSEKNSPL